MVANALTPRRLEQALEQRVLLAADPCALAAKQGRAEADLNDPARDFLGVDGCVQALALTRALRVRAAAVASLEAGADLLIVEAPSLEDTDLEEAGFALAYGAAELCCQAIDSVPGRGRRRFLLGRVEGASAAQIAGFIAGGVDALIADDTKAVAQAAGAAQAETGQSLPLLDGRRFPLVELTPQRLPAALAAGARLITGVDPAGLDAALRRLAVDGLRPLVPGVMQEEAQTPSSLHHALPSSYPRSAA
ncbi:LEPR-XLL domain-containing protein [Algihabitans sp.]|uniref:LEPR-XLL domain-containing protein n=1 Tax=Algihabitans sp. TaxID=2821514 RepID=UPI003BAD5502